MAALVDTNILVYAYQGRREPVKAGRAVQFLKAHQGSLAISVQTLTEFAAVMLRQGQDATWVADRVLAFRVMFPVLEVDAHIVANAVRAVREHQMSFWDAQIWAVAECHGIPIIYTEDGPVGQSVGGIAFVNPLVD